MGTRLHLTREVEPPRAARGRWWGWLAVIALTTTVVGTVVIDGRTAAEARARAFADRQLLHLEHRLADYLRDHPGECPLASELAARTTDPWGNAFVVVCGTLCSDGERTADGIWSPGPDGERAVPSHAGDDVVSTALRVCWLP